MRNYPIPDKLTKAAMDAHCNLNIFAAIASIVEAGVIYGGENTAAKKILAICAKEQQRQLQLQDKAVAAMSAQQAKPPTPPAAADSLETSELDALPYDGKDRA